MLTNKDGLRCSTALLFKYDCIKTYALFNIGFNDLMIKIDVGQTPIIQAVCCHNLPEI